MPNLSFEPKAYLWRSGLIIALYAGIAILFVYFFPNAGPSIVVWFATPIAFGLVALWRAELLPNVAYGAFVVPLLFGSTTSDALIFSIANTAEVAVGIYLLRQSPLKTDPRLNRLRDTLSIIIVALFSGLLSASAFVIVSILVNGTTVSLASWGPWWITHAVGSLSFLPFVFRWAHYPHFDTQKASFKVYIERSVGFGFLILILSLSYAGFVSIGNIPMLYLLPLTLIWAALRTGPSGTTLAIAITATASMFNALQGGVGQNIDSQTVFNMQIFSGALAIIFLPFSALVEERKEAVRTLGDHVFQLESALEKISAEDKAKGEFLAVLAHELRNPLSPILSGLELLKSEGRSAPDILNMMAAHTHAIARLLDDLLDFSRISQKKFKLQKEPVELSAIIYQTLEMVQPYITTQKHTLTLDIPEKEIWFNADPVRLTQIFSNILNNSAKYTDPGGHILLAAQKKDGDVHVKIKDTGIGIAKERIENIFEPFASGAPVRKPGGLRIGLSLAKRMVELHGGSITVSSDGVGKGSEFVICLPSANTEQAALPVGRRVRTRFSKQELKINKKNMHNILLVDDNESAAQSLAILLEKNGHVVELAYDAPDAIEKLQKIEFNVAILDIGLPTMTGYELARLVKEAQPEILLVALTGYGQEEDKQKALDAGFVHHLVKPVSIVDIQRALTSLNKKS